MVIAGVDHVEGARRHAARAAFVDRDAVGSGETSTDPTVFFLSGERREDAVATDRVDHCLLSRRGKRGEGKQEEGGGQERENAHVGAEVTGAARRRTTPVNIAGSATAGDGSTEEAAEAAGLALGRSRGRCLRVASHVALSLSREPLCPPLPLAASSRLGYVPVASLLKRAGSQLTDTQVPKRQRKDKQTSLALSRNESGMARGSALGRAKIAV